MKIPNLNKRVTVNRATYTSDGMAGQTYTTHSRGVWGAFSQVSGTEVYKFGGSETDVKFKLIVRHRPGTVIANSDTIGYEGRIFRIMYIEQGDFERNYITLYIVEDNANS